MPGIVAALDYLTASNRKGLGDDVPDFDSGALNAQGRDVVVVGGGDTAMDCVRTAVRQGATSVSCLYRRDRDNMPGSMREVANAEEEGVDFVWLSAPEAFLGGDPVEAVRGSADAARGTRRHRPAGARAGARLQHRSTGRSGDRRARLRSRGSGDAVRRAGPAGQPLGHAQDRLGDDDDRAARRVRRAATSCAVPRWSSGGCATVATPPPASTPSSRAVRHRPVPRPRSS